MLYHNINTLIYYQNKIVDPLFLNIVHKYIIIFILIYFNDVHCYVIIILLYISIT